MPYVRAINGEAATKDNVKMSPSANEVVKAELMCDCSMSLRWISAGPRPICEKISAKPIRLNTIPITAKFSGAINLANKAV